jgi:hypothetical protein
VLGSPRSVSEGLMKKTRATRADDSDELRSEYAFDYSKARPNRFADRITQDRLVVMLDPDVSEIFTTPESVNSVLRAIIAVMPNVPKPSDS